MKKITLTLFLLYSFLGISQTTPIPDSNFEQALIDLGIDTNGLTGTILNADAEAVTSLAVNGQGISDLTGIEAFINLTILTAGSNNYNTALDFSANTLLEELNLTAGSVDGNLDLTANTNLIDLDLAINNITGITGISGLTSLETLNISNNPLNTLDVSNLPSLRRYIFSNSPNLFTVDLSNSPNLTDVLGGNNTQLQTIDVKNGTNATNSLSLVIAGNNPNLTCITVDNSSDATNGLAPYDTWTVSNPGTIFTYSEDNCATTAIPDSNFEQALITLGIDTNGISGDIRNADASAVTSLTVNNSAISDLTGIEAFTNLVTLSAGSNNFTVALDFSSNTLLENLNLNFSSITGSLDLTSNTNLLDLDLAVNNITSITGISGLVNLQTINIATNPLSSLDVSGLTSLQRYIFNNCPNLNSIDLSGVSTLEDLVGGNNTLLQTIDVKNGTNSANGLRVVLTGNNPSFTCLNVDNATDATNGIAPYDDWVVSNPNATFSYSDNNCQTLSIEGNDSLENIIVFPTVVNNLLNINNVLSPTNIKIYSLSGKLLRTTTLQNLNNEISLESISGGIYFVQIENDSASSTFRIIKL